MVIIWYSVFVGSVLMFCWSFGLVWFFFCFRYLSWFFLVFGSFSFSSWFFYCSGLFFRCLWWFRCSGWFARYLEWSILVFVLIRLLFRFVLFGVQGDSFCVLDDSVWRSGWFVLCSGWFVLCSGWFFWCVVFDSRDYFAGLVGSLTGGRNGILFSINTTTGFLYGSAIGQTV